MGISTRLLLCGKLQVDVAGTAIETHFFKCIHTFYETSFSKLFQKYPFSKEAIKSLGFLNPCNRDHLSSAGAIQLATQFTSFTVDDMDNLSMEFQDLRVASDNQLPPFNLNEATVNLDHLWATMAEVMLMTDISTLHYSILSRLAKVLLILPHSNADPESVFNMVKKISTEQISQLDPSTVCDLLSVKINNDYPCYDNNSQVTNTLLSCAKSAEDECYIRR